MRRREAAATALCALSFVMSANALADPLADAAAWRIANDVVMGGVSNSRVSRIDDGLRFAGEVRLENNGGFASMRRPYAAAVTGMTQAAGFAVLARGDGNRYRLRVYTRDERGNEQWFAYFAVFDTRAGEVVRTELRWPQFAASFRGRAVADAPPLRGSDVIGIGVMITKADHRDDRGAFSLDLLRIEPLAD